MNGQNARDVETRASDHGAQSTHSRRQFLGLLGAGAAASVGLPRATAQEDRVVAMDTNYFDPIGLHVEPGATVRFGIESGSHSATAYRDRIPADATPFDSGTLSEGGFEHTFETPGTYDYYCRPHRSMGMVGRIVVGEPGGPAAETPIPDGDVPDSEAIRSEGAVSSGAFDGSGGGGHGGMMDSGPGTMDSESGMMDSESGMMNSGGPGWMMLAPLGFVTLLLGSVGGAVYLATRRGEQEGTTDGAMAALKERYAKGEIDEEQFERRFRRLREKDE